MADSRQGRVAVVTGAAAGIGQACAVRLATEGAAVALLDIAELEQTSRLIADAGGRSLSIRCDVADPASVRDARARVDRELGPASVLLNVAGTYPQAAFEDMTLDDWRQVLAINLDGPFHACQAFVPGMVELGGGRIVNFASGILSTNAPRHVHYFAAKMGVIGLTRGLANDLGGSNITVNAIAPGVIHTQSMIETAANTAMFETVEALQAIKRAGEVADIVGMVSFLASEEARFMTGQTVVVDGGIMKV